MIGPNFTNINLVLNRIEQIQRQCNPDVELPEKTASSRFVDVLDEVRRSGRGGNGRTSFEELRGVIDRCAEDYNIDQELIRAMIQVESGWDSRAVSVKGAQGLMQLMPRTAAMLGVSDPFDPEQNIEGGVKYISDLTDKYKGDVEKALAAYNAGPGRVDSGRTPASTSRYVRSIMALYHRYREED